MEVIILRHFRNLGNPGTTVKVKSGYAKNYLVPNGIAQYATKLNLAKLEGTRKTIMTEHEGKIAAAQQIKAQLENAIFTVIRNASDDSRLYGSVTTKDIIALLAKAISDLSLPAFAIDRGSVSLGNGIKTLGIHTIKVNLYSDIDIRVRLNVCRTESEAEVNLKAFEEKNKKPSTSSEKEDDQQVDTQFPAEVTETETTETVILEDNSPQEDR